MSVTTSDNIVEAASVAMKTAYRCVGGPTRHRYVALAALFDIYGRNEDRIALAEACGFRPGRPCLNAISNVRQYRRYGPRWWREEGGEANVEFVKTELRESSMRAARPKIEDEG